MSLFAATDLPHSKVDKLHNSFVKLKDESNYASWHKKMTLLFMGHKVMDIVLGEEVKPLSLPRPPATGTPDAAELDASADRQKKIATWTDRDIWAQSHIMATLSPERTTIYTNSGKTKRIFEGILCGPIGKQINKWGSHNNPISRVVTRVVT